jgi:hypothetical protein
MLYRKSFKSLKRFPTSLPVKFDLQYLLKDKMPKGSSAACLNSLQKSPGSTTFASIYKNVNLILDYSLYFPKID